MAVNGHIRLPLECRIGEASMKPVGSVASSALATTLLVVNAPSAVVKEIARCKRLAFSALTSRNSPAAITSSICSLSFEHGPRRTCGVSPERAGLLAPVRPGGAEIYGSRETWPE